MSFAMPIPGGMQQATYTVPLMYNDQEVGTAQVEYDECSGLQISAVIPGVELTDQMKAAFIDAISIYIPPIRRLYRPETDTFEIEENDR